MIDREQQTERTEAAIMAVLDNQYYTLTNQVINNMRRLSALADKWPPILLILFGALLLGVSIAIKVGLFGPVAMLTIWEGEFITMILSGAGLMVIGALFSLYQSRSLRKIAKAQQLVGTEILNKQIDVEKDLLERHQKQQAGQLILLPAKRLKRYRR